MSVQDLQTQGRQAYKRGDLNKALQFYNRALGRQQTVQLYDNRAATYEKLNNLISALDDAKQAIATGYEDPTGYLRAGRILVKMKKRETALEVYSRALGRVRHVGQGYEQLKKMRDELQTNLAPAHSIDPLTVLPRELAVAVLEYLNFRQRMAIRRVSKGWASFIRSEPNLWQHLDLGAAKLKVRTSFISLAINTAKGKLRAATLSKLYDFDKVVTALIRHCPLEKLTLAQTGLQGQNLVNALQKAKLKELRVLSGTEVGQTSFYEIAAICAPYLEILCWTSAGPIDFGRRWDELKIPHLRSLDIIINGLQSTSLLPRFLAGSPLLQELRLCSADRAREHIVVGSNPLDLTGSINLRTLHIRLSFCDANAMKLPESIEILCIENHSARTDLPFWPGTRGNTPMRLKELPRLYELSLDSQGTTLQAVLAELFPKYAEPDEDGHRQALSELRSLHVHRPNLSAFDPSDFKVGRCKNLERLALTHCLELDDKMVSTIVADLPKLGYLDISGTKVTGAGVKDILKLGRVQELVLNDCYSLGRDAVDWARAHGVKVSAKMDEGAGGRKVRY